MELDYWHRVERVLDLALESDPAHWSTVLTNACDNDRALRDDVEDLLSRYATARSFLETPPKTTAAALIAEARKTDGGMASSLVTTVSPGMSTRRWARA